MEPCAQKITRRNNPALVDIVFRLMFEILWVPSYDHRKDTTPISEFELTARSVANRLAATDLSAASPEELDGIRYAVDRLVRCIVRLDAERILPPERCAEALVLARRIAGEVREQCACPGKV